MKPESSKLRHRTAEEQQLNVQQDTQQTTDFATAEELIRHDAQQTAVPPEIAYRLNESISREPKSAKSWWKKIFSG
jgi:hypothetical protein